MRKREVFWLLALGLSAACDGRDTFGASLATLSGAPRRIAGTGDLAEPRFTSSLSLYLTVTDGGQPNLVFLVNGANLDWAPVSFRLPPAGAPSTPTPVGETLIDRFVTPDDDSSSGSVDGPTRYAVFLSQASNLLEPGSGVLFFRDSTQAFVKDLATGENFLVSMGVDGLPANHDVTSAIISGQGRFVVFATRATNLYDPESPSETPNGASQIYTWDLLAGELELVTTSDGFAPARGDSSDAAMTPDGRYVVFVSDAADLVAGDTNGTSDVFLYDRATKSMRRISEAAGGVELYLHAREPAISEDGSMVAFTAVNAVAGGPRQVYVRDVAAGTTTNISRGPVDPGNDDSASPSVSADGRFVAFASDASNIASDDTEGFSDVFVFDRSTGLVARASVDADGTGGGDGDSWSPSLSADGQFLAYISRALNVAPDDPDRLEGDANGLANLIVVAQPFFTP
jgi:WD40-like Beta Propeller Repeat